MTIYWVVYTSPCATEVHHAGFSTHQSPFEDPPFVFHIVGPQVTYPEVIVDNDEAEGKYQI